ncbi:hypothetical protein SO802_015153 [Lithocarpus litseifolius]|uniref:Uncharacterized protein n=1 Tax=Lithocarpus litseifolius TaxID=425828 RepID=A0AAW2CSW3_9ROSI
MNAQPSKHLVLINGYTHQGQWYEGDSHLSFRDPYALIECWRSYFNNQILKVIQDLWKDYHFIGSTDKISIFGLQPYDIAIRNLRRIGHTDPREYLTGPCSPLKEICKDPDVLYALLKIICKEEEAGDDHDSEDEWSFKASVTKTHITPTIRNGLIMMKKTLLI